MIFLHFIISIVLLVFRTAEGLDSILYCAGPSGENGGPSDPSGGSGGGNPNPKPGSEGNPIEISPERDRKGKRRAIDFSPERNSDGNGKRRAINITRAAAEKKVDETDKYGQKRDSYGYDVSMSGLMADYLGREVLNKGDTHLDERDRMQPYLCDRLLSWIRNNPSILPEQKQYFLDNIKKVSPPSGIGDEYYTGIINQVFVDEVFPKKR